MDLARQLLNTSDSPKFLTEAELAERWKLSKDYLSNLRRAGRVPPYIQRGQGRALYPLDGVEAYEKANLHIAKP